MKILSKILVFCIELGHQVIHTLVCYFWSKSCQVSVARWRHMLGLHTGCTKESRTSAIYLLLLELHILQPKTETYKSDMI